MMRRSSQAPEHQGGGSAIPPATRRAAGPGAAVAFSGVVTLLLLTVVAIIAWGTYRVHSVEEEIDVLQRGVGRLAFLDGAMTRSVGMSALQRDTVWKARYEGLAAEFEREVEAVVEGARLVGSSASVERIVEVERRMGAVEREALDLASRGERLAALRLLSSPGYTQLKEDVSGAMREIESAGLDLQRRYNRSVRRFILMGGVLASAVVLALAAVWLWVFRILRRYVRERDHAEQALARSRQELSAQRGYLRSAIDASPNLIFAKDRDGRFTLANRAVAEVYGTTPEELVGKTDADFNLQFAEVEAFLRADRQVIDAEEGMLVAEEPITDSRTGEVRWYQTVKVRLDPPDGGPPQALGIATDLTARKNAEAERAAAEAHYRRLVTTSPEAIFVLDAQGHFAEVNPALERLLERPQEEVMGHHFSEFIAPEDLARAEEEFTSLISGGKATPGMEIHMLRPSGERRVVAVRSAVIIDEGTTTGIQGIIHDVTEQRSAEEQGRLLATVLDRLTQGVVVTDPGGKVVYANPATSRLLGVDPERVAELVLEDFLPDGKAREEAMAIERILRNQGQWSGRLWRRRLSDGNVIPLDCVAGRVALGEGAEEYVLSLFHDASQAIEMERHLRRAERLTSLGTLVRGVAHELNNPLHAIRNFADLMLLERRNEDDREALGFIRQEADRAAEVVADMHRFARQAEEESDRSVVSLNDAVREAIKLHEYGLRTGRVELVQELAEDLPPIRACQAQVEQVVLRLLSNAAHAMEEWGGARRLSVRTRPSALGAAVEILDSGPGIPPEHLEQIFDPFWTTSAPSEGTGLGLSVVHSIVADHGGYIRVESQPGQGTTFVVDFPLAWDEDAPG